MPIAVHTPDEGFTRSLSEITHLFKKFPLSSLSVDWELTEENLSVTVQVNALEKQDTQTFSEAVERGESNLRNQLRRLARRAVLQVLAGLSGEPVPPWGILTGVRPSKVAHRLLDDGMTPENAVDYLADKYALRRDKAGLLLEVTQRQRPYMPVVDPAEQGAGEQRQVGIYIGIPFCPTRCAYCSFPSYPVQKYKGLVEDYLTALNREIDATGQLLKMKGLVAATLYLGGGTPTVLSDGQLRALLERALSKLPLARGCEMTCEAGRPDTVTIDKLRVLKDSGVDRVSINPQSMQENTLQAIGRCHTPEEVVRAVEMVRKVGLPILNMDLIAGLPGETLQDMEKTLSSVLALHPENVTVHTLALKRASQMREDRLAYVLPGADIVEEMMKFADGKLRREGLFPYYLYRQKAMAGPLENVGYTREAAVCRYNIQIMEERESIVGLGAGAGTKIVHLAEDCIDNIYNPKEPWDYIARLEEMVVRKRAFLNNVG